MTDTNTLRSTLAVHLDTLKRNLEVVPLEILKTKYKKPFDVLCRDISLTASSYVRQTALGGMRIRKDLADEAKTLIESSIRRSGLLRKISTAAFRHQDISEIDSLALALREQAQKALAPLYGRHLSLYISAGCLRNPPMVPELYNAANGCIWRDGKWLPLEYIKTMPENSMLQATPPGTIR